MTLCTLHTYVNPFWLPMLKVVRSHVGPFSPLTPLLAHPCCEAAWLTSISTHQYYQGLNHTDNHQTTRMQQSYMCRNQIFLIKTRHLCLQKLQKNKPTMLQAID